MGVAYDTRAGWQAHLALGFSHRDGRTLLSDRRHSGPLQVQRPFYPETNDTCHVYILHPPGGLVGGDRLSLEAELAPNTQALLTTPAAGKFYRSNGATARQTQSLRAAAGSSLEWLPQENIVFAGARVHALTRIELRGDAGFIGWEILCLGRPAAGEIFAQGACHLGLELWRDGLPLYIEHGRYRGGCELLNAPWGLQGFPVTATLVCTGDKAALAEAVRSAVGLVATDELFAVSQLQGVLIGRYLGFCAARAHSLLSRAWMALRPIVLGKAAVVPRIWNT